MQFRFDDGPWDGGECIAFIYAVNRLATKRGGKPVFGAPISDVGSRDWCGERRYVEEYKGAWVVGPLARNFDGWRVIPRTKRAERLMTQAHKETVHAGTD